MTINTLIDNQTQLARLEARRPGLVASAAAATEALTKAPAGYKATIARLQEREASTLLSELDLQITDLKAQTTESQETKLYFANSYAAYCLKLEDLEAEKALAEQQLAEALEEAKKGAWKWQGRKDAAEPAPVLAARRALASNVAASAALEKEYASTKTVIAEIRDEEMKDIEFKAWLSGGPKPEFIRLSQEAERKEMLEGCITLSLRTDRLHRLLPEADAEAEAEAEDPAWWSMTVAQYIDSLLVKEKEKGKEKEKVKEKVLISSRMETTSSWIQRFVQLRKERLAAASSSPS